MKHPLPTPQSRCGRLAAPALAALLLGLPAPAHASFLEGEALDSMAEAVSWVAIIVAPAVIITIFWLLHIMPEKIAEKRRHPQAKAIQCLCLLSLFFGGLLWPIAWLWAYSKPVLHKIAYGTDMNDSQDAKPVVKGIKPEAFDNAGHADNAELQRLRLRVAELESQNINREGTV